MQARPILIGAMPASSLCVLPGCLISGKSNTTMFGAYIGPSTFREIEPGVTKVAWILAVLGEPTSKATLDDGSKIWKWVYSRRHSGSGGVFLLVGGSSRTVERGATYVQIRDGVVERAWRD